MINAVAATRGPGDTDRVSTPSLAAEARQRWGRTTAFRESQRRAAAYTPADWACIRAEARDIDRRLAETMRSGISPTSDIATGLAEEHRRHLAHWFYDCSPALHRDLGDMYVADARFTAHYDEVAPGLASYLRDAIHANADRLDS